MSPIPFTIPDYANAGTPLIQAGPDAVDFDALVAADNGNGIRSGLAVTQNGGGAMNVLVAAGSVMFNTITVAVAAATVTITTANGSNPRLDLIVSTNLGVLSAVAGTAAAAPVCPAIPASSVLIAAVLVPTSTSAILTANITDKRITVSAEPVANAMAAVGRLRTYGHSWTGADIHAGTWAFDMKADRLLAARLKLPGESVENFAHSGARLSDELVQGSWVNVARRQNPAAVANDWGVAGNSTPYSGRGSVYLCAWPAQNDMAVGVTTALRAQYTDTMFAVCNRFRASFFAPSDGFLAFTYGAGFTAQSQTSFNSGSSVQKATTTTTATITYTIPSDYTGQALCFYFIGMPGVTGGTVTWSGTAGLTGTLVTDSRTTAASGKHNLICKRFTGLTSANQGQTVIMTATTVNGTVYFDGMSIEADNPPIVLWMNTARLLAAGYTFYGSVFGDSDVATWNTDITTTANLFTDGFVQVVDVDTALGKSAANFNVDGYHPNETGHRAIAQACLNSLQTAYVSTNNFGNSPLPMGKRRGLVTGQYYTSPDGGVLGTTTATLNDLTASSFDISEWSALDQVVIDVVTTNTLSKLRVGLYFSDETQGYPGLLFVDLGDVATTTLAYGAPTTLSNLAPPPSKLWIVGLVTGTNVAVIRTLNGQNPDMPSPAGITLVNGWYKAGFTGGVLPNVFPQGAVTNNTKIPRIALRSTTGRTF